jgi:hypothetical protein
MPENRARRHVPSLCPGAVIPGPFPTGEGVGYAGGIRIGGSVTAADDERGSECKGNDTIGPTQPPAQSARSGPTPTASLKFPTKMCTASQRPLAFRQNDGLR